MWVCLLVPIDWLICRVAVGNPQFAGPVRAGPPDIDLVQEVGRVQDPGVTGVGYVHHQRIGVLKEVFPCSGP